MVLDRFRRLTRDGRWIAEIDGLRFVAIATVVLFHMMGELVNRSGAVLAIDPRYHSIFGLIANGDRGVRLFFVISGFVLALPFARSFRAKGPSISLRKFYLRRVTRLEPPFLLSLALIAAMAGVYFHGWPKGFGTHFVMSGLYLHSIAYGGPSWVNPVTWSLEVEIQFYLVAPLFMQLLRIRRTSFRRGLLLTLIVLSGIVQVPYWNHPLIPLTILFYVQYFLAGLLVADVYTVEMPSWPQSFWWDAMGILGWPLVFLVAHDAHWAHVVLPIVFAGLTMSALKSKYLRNFFAAPWIAATGGMCYSIYLLHFAFIAAIFKFTRHAILFHDFLANYMLQLVVTVVPAVLLCSVFYLLVERPCMDPAWPSKLWRYASRRSSPTVRAFDSSLNTEDGR